MKHDVTAEEAGRRIDQLLSGVQGIGSRSKAERLVRDGHVLVDGRGVIKSHRVQRGEVVEVPDELLKRPEPKVYQGAPVPVLYEDDDMLVIDKPAGMVVHPAPGHRDVTLVEMLASSGVTLSPNTDERFERPGVVHRLDKDTSGVIMFAKNEDSHRALQKSLQDRTARREYTALVNGMVPSRAGRIEAPIGRDVRDATKRSIDTDLPQDAVTHFVVTEILPTTTLLRLRLETGRTHQIRVHLEAIGHPVIGDTQYGNGPQFGLSRQFLHAARLTLPHPITGESIEVASPLPDELHAALAEARRDRA